MLMPARKAMRRRGLSVRKTTTGLLPDFTRRYRVSLQFYAARRNALQWPKNRLKSVSPSGVNAAFPRSVWVA
jgi:hypothetical protein